MDDQTVYVLSINHKHGTDVSVHRHQEGALSALASYVAQEWTREMPHGAVKPKSKGKAIQQYFGEHDHGESFAIEERDVED